MPDRLNHIVASSKAEQIATGFEFTEGPLWHPDGYLLFVDLRRNNIHRWRPGGQVELVRSDSNGTNGLTWDTQGRLIMCEGDARRVTRREADGSIIPIAERWEGKRLHRPNDVVCRSDGNIYITNPAGRIPPEAREIHFSGVIRVTPDGQVLAATTDTPYPNGIAFSPNEATLYVANSRPEQYIKAYSVAADGSLYNGRVFADMSSAETDGVPDGMKVDSIGRVFATGPRGCWVFNPDGSHVGIIRLPEIPANCAWGSPDLKTLYFTARHSVYSLRMRTAGIAAWKAPAMAKR